MEFVHFLFSVEVASKLEHLDIDKLKIINLYEKIAKIYWTQNKISYSSIGKKTIKEFINNHNRDKIRQSKLNSLNINNLREQGIVGTYLVPSRKSGFLKDDRLELNEVDKLRFSTDIINQAIDIIESKNIDIEEFKKIDDYLKRFQKSVVRIIFDKYKNSEAYKYSLLVDSDEPFKNLDKNLKKIKDQKYVDLVKSAIVIKTFCENLIKYFDLSIVKEEKNKLKSNILKNKNRVKNILTRYRNELIYAKYFIDFLKNLNINNFDKNLFKLHTLVMEKRNKEKLLKNDKYEVEMPYANYYIQSLKNKKEYEYDLRWRSVFKLKKVTRWKS
jgi:acetolactate synthase regulatory subunit